MPLSDVYDGLGSTQLSLGTFGETSSLLFTDYGDPAQRT